MLGNNIVEEESDMMMITVCDVTGRTVVMW